MNDMLLVFNLALTRALTDIFSVPSNRTSVAEFQLADLGHADCASSVAFQFARDIRKSPAEIAGLLVERLRSDHRLAQYAESIEVQGGGYINVYLNQKTLVALAVHAYQPRPRNKKEPPVMVDFSSPNVAKPMGIGHLRSTIIGEAISRILEWNGTRVIRANHLGDWGTQFGKLIVMIKDRNVKQLKDVSALVALYIEFHELAKSNPSLEERAREEAKKLQMGDRTNRSIWKKISITSYKDYEKVYRQFGVHFDVVKGESAYNAALPGIVKRALAKKIAVRSEGAVIIPFVDLETPMVIEKTNGSYLYATTDLAALEFRVKRYHVKKILYVVGQEQSFHFEQLKRAAALLGIAPSDTVEHVKFGLMLGADHKKLSTRSGSSGGLQEVLDEAVQRARDVIASHVNNRTTPLSRAQQERIAQVVGRGAVLYNDLSQNRVHDIVVDWERMLSFTGNSAPYLQYSIVRMNGILRKARVRIAKNFSPSSVIEPIERELLRRVARFPSVVASAGTSCEPHRVAEYLYQLATAFHQFYEQVPVLTTDKKIKTQRCALLGLVRDTLRTGLKLLGIEAPENM